MECIGDRRNDTHSPEDFPGPVIPGSASFDWNKAYVQTRDQHITGASVKREPDRTDRSDQATHCNCERKRATETGPSSIKSECVMTVLHTEHCLQTAHQNHEERTVAESEMILKTCGKEEPENGRTGGIHPVSVSAGAKGQNVALNNPTKIDTALSSGNQDSQHTRTCPDPFVSTPSIDSSDNEQELNQAKSLSNVADTQTGSDMKYIVQEPHQSDSSQNGSQQPLRRSHRSQGFRTNIGDGGKWLSRPPRNTRQLKPAKPKGAKGTSTKANAKASKKEPGSKTCHVCEKTFTRTESLTVHMRVHTGDRPYQCQHCDATYKIAGHLRDHMRSKHSSSRPYLCTKCGKDFSYPTARHRHEKVCGKNLSERIEFKCQLCDKGFVTAKGFAKHQTICGSFDQGENAEKDKELPFKCCNCDKSFATSPGLDRHQRFVCGKVPPKGVYTCEECGKTYEKRDRFQAHLRRHTGEKPFKCTLCDNQFYDQGALKKHLNRHEENRKFRCSMCEAAFYERQALSVHVMRVHCGLKPFKCNECDADLSSAYQLSRHIRNLHRQERPFKCMLCDKEFFDAKPYKKHMHQHTVQLTNPNQLGPKRPKQHTCNICNRPFFWRALGAHVASEHPGMTLSDVLKKEVFTCDLCSREFSCQQTLRVHKRRHTSTKRFKCDKCERQFAVLSALRFHSSKHSDERPHCCQDCGKTFRWLSNLSYHRMTHHTPKPDYAEVHIDSYVCNECGRGFRRENFLYLHLKLKRHGQGTPCICSQCGRGYTDIEDYKSHMSTHDMVTVKPFICSLCGAGFYYQHILDRHHRQRHVQPGRSSWLCEECGKYFTRKVYLQKHMARHAKYPQGRIPPAGRPRKDSRSPEPLQHQSPEYLPASEIQNCAIQTGVDSEVSSGLGHAACLPPAFSSQSHSDVPQGHPQPSEELPSVSLFELQNYQSHYSTFIHHTLAWPKPDEH